MKVVLWSQVLEVIMSRSANRLQVGGDPEHGALGPDVVCKKKIYIYIFKYILAHCSLTR